MCLSIKKNSTNLKQSPTPQNISVKRKGLFGAKNFLCPLLIL